MTICIAGKNQIAIDGVACFWTAIQAGGHKLVASINATDNGENHWQPSFKYFCEQNGIPIVRPADLYDEDDLLLLSLEYDKLIKTSRFRSKRLYNIHFSLLPAYKGMYTSVWPLLNGERYTGVTLHCMDDGIDTGNIIDQEAIEISDTAQAKDLYHLYLATGSRIVSRNAEKLLNSQLTGTVQKTADSTYYSRSTVDFSNITIDLNKTAWEIHNQIRAFSFRDYQLPVVAGSRIFRSQIMPERTIARPGTILAETETSLRIATVDYDIYLYKDRLDELLEAAASGSLSSLLQITNTGFDINTRTRQGWNPLIVAAYHGHTPVVKYLLSLGLDINMVNYRGTTLLMYAMTYASRTGDLMLMEHLLRAGSNTSLIDDRGRDVLSYAREYNNPAVIAMLEAHHSRRADIAGLPGDTDRPITRGFSAG